jgi:hypothetical protein
MTLSEGSHLLTYDANDNPLYEGWALRTGSDTSQAVWKMKKYIWATGTGGDKVMQEEAWADGNMLYDNIWDNRATTVTYTQAV